MYHIHCKGTHYEIGYTLGKRLYGHGICIIEQAPFVIDEQRHRFAQACIPFYEQYYPAILDEVKGISDGNHCSYECLLAMLFAMYCIMPEDVHCSCFAIKNESGTYFGRNSDFLVSIEKLYMNVIYQFSNASYHFEGNTTAFCEMEDGINEHGLIIGLTSVYPKQIQPGLHAGFLLRLMLETCRNIQEALALLHDCNIASSQTFTMIDATGSIVCVECSCDKIATKQITDSNGFVCATNTFHLQDMLDQKIAVEDDWFAQERYDTMYHALLKNYTNADMQFVQEVLSGKYGFLCQYDRKQGRDTVWSICYDGMKKQYYQVDGNPSRKAFKKDVRFVK